MALDDFRPARAATSSGLEASPRFRLDRWDVRLPLPVEGSFDWIFNLASPASPVHYQSDP